MCSMIQCLWNRIFRPRRREPIEINPRQHTKKLKKCQRCKKFESSTFDDGIHRRAFKDYDRIENIDFCQDMICPITHMPMQDPVIICDGYSYERNAITNWFKYHNTSPTTGRKIPKVVIPNHNLRLVIQTWSSESFL